MYRPYLFICCLMFVAAGFPMLVIRYATQKADRKLVVWKKILCIVLFEISFAPTATNFLLGRGNMGFLDCLYFIMIWLIFCIFSFSLPAKISIIAPVFLGLLLVEPLSLFVAMTDHGLTVVHRHGHTVDLAIAGNKVAAFFQDFYRLAWAVFPLIGFHYLLGKRVN